MGPQRRPDPGRLEVETDRELAQRLGPPAVDATVHSQPRQPQWTDRDRHRPAAEVAAIKLEQAQRLAQALDHRLHLIDARPAQESPGGRSRATGRSSGELGCRKRELHGFCAFIEQPCRNLTFTVSQLVWFI